MCLNRQRLLTSKENGLKAGRAGSLVVHAVRVPNVDDLLRLQFVGVDQQLPDACVGFQVQGFVREDEVREGARIFSVSRTFNRIRPGVFPVLDVSDRG